MNAKRTKLGLGAKVAIGVAVAGGVAGLGYRLTRRGGEKTKGPKSPNSKDKPKAEGPAVEPLKLSDAVPENGEAVFYIQPGVTYEFGKFMLMDFDPGVELDITAAWLETLDPSVEDRNVAEYLESAPAGEWEIEMGGATLSLSRETGKIRLRLDKDTRARFFVVEIFDAVRRKPVFHDSSAFTVTPPLA